MDQTNGPLSGMESTSFHADSTSIFGTASTSSPLPSLTQPQSAGGSAPVSDHDGSSDRANESVLPGQAGLLGRETKSRSASRLDEFVENSNQTHSLEFRVARADSPVRRLRLTGNRYTFGSAEGCSIRLNDANLRPMHAVLTRDRDRVVVRAYSVPISVNENRVNEASLAVGDRIRLGEYEFELLSISTQPATTTSAGFDPSQGTRSQETRSRETTSQGPKLSSVTDSGYDQIDPEETVWRQRLRKEIDQWRSKQVECDLRESRCDEREAHLRGRESELWSRAENLYRREAKVQDQESAVFQMHDDYADRQQELLRLREDTHQKQRLFQQRESEFAQQESEYRQKLEEATAHLLQSQAQATAATNAVQEMRQQFDALNQQIEELSDQQSELKRSEEAERDENQRMRSDLEAQRDAAIDAQAEGEARRREAIDRVEEMTAELDSLRSKQAEGGEAESQKLLENEATIDSLRKQVEDLQETVDEASEEATRLRGDYRDALDSVRQLESLVAQSNERGDTDRDQWATDADSLRAEIESLSGDLEKTQADLDELRQANESLTNRLHEVETERDQAVQEISDRPTREAFDHLRSELENANQTLEDLRQGITKNNPTHEVASDEVEGSSLSIWNRPKPKIENESAVSDPHAGEVAAAEENSAGAFADNDFASEAVVEQPPATENEPAFGTADEAEQSTVDVEQSSPQLESHTEEGHTEEGHTEDGRDEEVHEEESPDEVWPTYQMPEEVVPDSDVSIDSDPQGGTESSLSIWNLEAGEGHSEVSIENTGVWNPEQASESFSKIQQESTSDNENEPAPSPWNQVASDEDVNEHAEENNDDQDAALGSLASQLIADLDNSDSVQQVVPSNFQEVEPEAAAEPEPVDDQPSFVSEDANEDISEESVFQEPVAIDGQEEEEEVVGLMSHLANDVDEVEQDSTPSEVARAWDSEHLEESISQPLEDSASDSVWDIENLSNDSDDSDGFSDSLSSAADDNAPSVADLDQPQDRIDATAMMASVDELEDEEPVQEESFASYHQSVDPIEAEPTVTTPPESPTEMASDADADEGSEDDSIEAYMNRLLGRVQGTPGSEAATAPESVSLSTSPSSSTSVPEGATETDSATLGPQPEIDPDAPLVPRSKAPERNRNLSAMRDLANQSARNAISRSTRIQTRNMQMAGVMNFGVAVVAILFGVGASLFLSGGLLYLILAMVVIISVISVRDGLKNLAEARTRMQAAERGELPEALEETLATEDEPAAKAEDRLALQNAAAQAAREQH